MQSSRVPFGRKLAFAIADLFGGGSFNIINFLYPTFLAMTVGLSAYWIGFIMLVARIWDAITDPLMGYLSDATRSRLGKRRIYILIAAPLVLISFFLMFYPYAFESVGLRVVAVLLSYIFFATSQTMVMIPYYALSSELTSDYSQRASANGLRLGFSIFSSILCVAIPGMLVDRFPDKGQGYIVMSLIFGTVFMLALLVTALFTKEEIQTPPVRKKFSFRALLQPFKFPEYRQYLGMSMCLSLSMAIMSSLFFFFIDFHIMRDTTLAGESNMVGQLSAALMFAMQIVALPFYLWLIKKTSKAFAYRAGAILWMIGGLIIFLLKPGMPLLPLYLLAALLGFGISGPGLVPHAIFGDVMDAAQLASGTRNEGAFSGLTNLFTKVAQATGIALVMAVLGLAGFVEQAPGAEAVRAQPLSAQHALTVILALTPILFMGIGTLISRRYKIDQKRHDEIADGLRIQQMEQEGGPFA